MDIELGNIYNYIYIYVYFYAYLLCHTSGVTGKIEVQEEII